MKFKSLSIGNRLTLLISILFTLITLVNLAIVLYTIDNYLSAKKNADLAVQTVESLEAFADSVEATVSHEDNYHFYVVGSVPKSNDPLGTRNVNNKPLVFPKNSKILVANDTIIIQIDDTKYELVITENLTANSKSRSLTGNLYYFCVPFKFENLRYYIISIYDTSKDMSFKNQMMELIVFIVFVGIGILFVFSNIFVKTSLEPLIGLANEAINIDITKNDTRLKVPHTDDEIAILTESLNQMLDNIDKSYKKTKQFTQDASHELRIPLTVILGNIELIQNFSEDKDILHESVDAIKSEAENMKSMIERLLTITRLENQSITPTYEKISLRDFLVSVGNEMETLYGRLIKVKSPDMEINTDKGLLVQLLRAIVDNAMKYSEDEVVIVGEHLQEEIVIKIIDYGTGIKKEDMTQIKNRFYRADSSRNSKTGGTGLGLAIAETIADSLGGRIEIHSEYGEGTMVTLFLPI
ncbi:MAG: HAMP domain-containing sensor histidine kinase [Bacillota bacterium]|nr:HAMP domain-containing sensor histidine kinase [Bacillota bacterium]